MNARRPSRRVEPGRSGHRPSLPLAVLAPAVAAQPSDEGVLVPEVPSWSALRIDVDTFKGLVTLSGRVKSKDEETKAIALARQIKGVTDVKSTLQINSSRE